MDGGSTDNLAAKEMVQKLGLKRVRHPYHYRIGQFQGDHVVEVWKQCPMDFQIGQYKDQVLCDIVDMNICYMLLGRTWQYDCKVMHDYVKNVITIEKDGRKHVCMPLHRVELNKRNLSVGSRIDLFSDLEPQNCLL